MQGTIKLPWSCMITLRFIVSGSLPSTQHWSNSMDRMGSRYAECPRRMQKCRMLGMQIAIPDW